MKRLITLYMILFFIGHVCAQEAEKSITLSEVTVEAAKVVSKSDGMLIYPTDAQKQASNNAYSMLEKLSLANLRVDPVAHSVTAIDNRGGFSLESMVL